MVELVTGPLDYYDAKYYPYKDYKVYTNTWLYKMKNVQCILIYLLMVKRI
jgi:hypothetical protein